MGNKNAVILAAVALIAIFAMKYMSKQMVPYVPYAEAISRGEYVQIIGRIDRGKGIAVGKDGVRFTLIDNKGSMPVIYEGESPKFIEEAEKIVAIGTYDKAGRIFRADSVLTKCPSKYEKRNMN